MSVEEAKCHADTKRDSLDFSKIIHDKKDAVKKYNKGWNTHYVTKLKKMYNYGAFFASLSGKY